MSNQETVKLIAVGDMMLGDLPHCFGFGVGSQIEKHGPHFPFDRCLDELKQADLLFGNLEVVLSAFNWKSSRIETSILRGQPEAVKGLSQAGFDVVSLANNHIMQHGRKALEETIDILNEKGIKYVGVEIPEKGITNQAIFEINGISIGFLGHNLRPQQYFLDPPLYVSGKYEQIKINIERLRKEVEIIVISLHWGEEFVDYPSSPQIDLARKIIDCGADIILGHHSHMIQGVEKYKGKIIAYSLGNFIFDMWQERLRESIILKIEFDKNANIDYDIVPVMINKKFQPTIASTTSEDKIRTHIQAISKKIQNSSDELAYEKTVKTELRKYRYEVYWHYLSNCFRYNPRLFYLNLIAAIKRRIK